jgi:glycosyltransferase involved in cell wall biosynthesis
MPGSPRFAVVIPAFNEVATIADVVARALKSSPWVIVIDDGSTDGTAAQLRRLAVEVLRNDTNQGKASAIWRGAEHAIAHGADAVITLDGDGQHRPEDIPRLLEVARHHPNDLVLGARALQPDAAPKLRRFANHFADFWISIAAGYRVRDSQSGFRYYPASVFQRVRVQHDRPHGFVLESEILIEAARLNVHAHTVPIETIYLPRARRSHYRPVLDTLRITRMVTGKVLRRWLLPPRVPAAALANAKADALPHSEARTSGVGR